MREWQTGSTLIRQITQCSECLAVDHAALDRWAEQAAKELLSGRAQRIAVASETEPFAFVQSSNEELSLREILLQALAASAAHGAQLGASGNASDGKRETAIFRALSAEVERAMEQIWKRGYQAALEGKEAT